MSGNKLLAESTIRRFMKLANVDAMTNNFISENFEDEISEEDKEETNEEVVSEEDETIEEQAEEEMELDAELGEPEPDTDAMADLEPEMDAEPEMGAADMSLTEDEARLLIDLGERLSSAMDESASDDDPALDAPAEDALDSEEPGLEDAPEEEEEDAAYRVTMQEDLVQEVLKRVTKRLVAAKLKNRK